MDKAKDLAGQAGGAISGAAGAVREKVAGLGGAAQGAVGSVGQRAHDVYDQGRAATRSMGRGVQAGYRSSADQFAQAVDDYPLAVGIGFAALGALVGLLLPRTRGEDQLLGAQSDQLVDAVKDTGRDVIERGRAVAERVGETALDEAQKQGLTAETGSEAVSGLAGKAGEVLRRVAEEAKDAAREEGLTPGQLKSEVASSTGSGGQSGIGEIPR
jgi:ElaB/YqjD/DUF883 family membrane-anchored ribosome-binding protein